MQANTYIIIELKVNYLVRKLHLGVFEPMKVCTNQYKFSIRKRLHLLHALYIK
jgi:hypothetical protein